MKNNHTDMMQKLCDKYNLKFSDMSDPKVQSEPRNQFKGFFEQFNEQSGSTFDEVQLGIYKNPENRLLDFFYILALQVNVQEGRIPKNYDEFPYHNYPDALAWKTALRIAKENGLEFTQGIMDKKKESFHELFKDGSPERSPAKFWNEASKLAFGNA